MKFNLKQVKYKNIIEYKTVRVEKVFWVTININAWTDSVGEWGRLPVAILDYLCLTFRSLIVGEENHFFHVFLWPPHAPWSPTQNKQIGKKMNNFVVVVCYWGSNPESCICAAKCWLHHPALILFFKPFSVASYRTKYIAFNVEDWMHIDRVTHDIPNCWTQNIPGVVEQVPSSDERQLVERVGSRRINDL